MIKRSFALAFAALTLLALLLLSSCGKKDMLATPEGLAVNENNQLSWSAVESARTYTIVVKNTAGEEVLNKTTRKTNYSLSDLSMGDYEIRIMAQGGVDNDLTSDWSEALLFHRDYETGCEYELINGNTEYQIKRGKNASGTVLIEATYRGKPVTAIAADAFKGNRNIVEVVLGENIRTIGDNAFYNCAQLTSITLPEGLNSIGSAVFQGCRALTTVNIPAGLSIIPEYCFAYCRALTSITIGEQVRVIGNSAFAGAALRSVTVPDGVVSIGEYTFSAMEELTDVTIGKTVLTLGANAFSDNPKLTTVTFAQDSNLTAIKANCFANDPVLVNITLPESLTDIGNRVFYQCTALETINIPDKVTHIGSFVFNATKLYMDTEGDFVYAGKWLVAVKNLDQYVKITAEDFRADTVGISDNCFYHATKLENVTLSSKIETVGSYAFASCPVLVELHVGASVIRLQSAAFMDCPYLYKVFLEVENRKATLTEIGDYAFAGCTQLENNQRTSIIPDSVRKIGIKAFLKTGLWSKPEDGIIYAGNWVVGYDSNATLGAATLKYDEEHNVLIRGIADYAFMDCTTLTMLGNLAKCLYIGEGAFYGCTELESVVLNNRLTALPDYVFYKCAKLYKVDMPAGLESIGRSAFYKCSTLKSLDFANTLEFRSIGKYAFYKCTNLSSADFGENLTEIGDYAFARCTALTAIQLPDTMTVLNDHVFAFCSSVSELKLSPNITEIGPYAFYKCSALTEVVIPDAVTSIGSSAFYKCEALEKLTIGKNVTSIGDYAFYNVKPLSQLQLPATLASVGKYAFKGAEALTTLIISANVKEIRAYAFYGCKRATIYVEEGADLSGWNLRWNPSNRPTILNAKLSDDKTYVVSVSIAAGSVLNDKTLATDIAPTAPPERAGFTFAGWQRPDGTTVETKDLAAEAAGTVLTAIWVPAE